MIVALLVKWLVLLASLYALVALVSFYSGNPGELMQFDEIGMRRIVGLIAATAAVVVLGVDVIQHYFGRRCSATTAESKMDRFYSKAIEQLRSENMDPVKVAFRRRPFVMTSLMAILILLPLIHPFGSSITEQAQRATFWRSVIISEILVLSILFAAWIYIRHLVSKKN